MASLTSSHVPTLHPTAVARLLHEVCGDLARAAAHRLPGLEDTFHRDVVVIADASRTVGELGSFAAKGCRIGNRDYDKLAVSVRHHHHVDADREKYAANILATLAHELAHVHVHRSGERAAEAQRKNGHTEDFAEAARRFGLEVVYCPRHPSGITTPALTAAARDEHHVLVRRLAQLNLFGTRGVALAGPNGIRGALHPNLQAHSYFSLASTS